VKVSTSVLINSDIGLLHSAVGHLYEPAICEAMSKNLKHKMRQALQNNEVPMYSQRNVAVHI
jgi:hypothetical protein